MTYPSRQRPSGDGRTRHLLLWACLSALGTTPAIAAETAYDQTDLQALAAQGSWSELLQHATDIKPGARGKAWQRLVRRAATQWLAAPVIERDPRRAVLLVTQLFDRYPVLQRDRVLRRLRSRFAIKALRACLAHRRWQSWCEQRYRAFVDGDDSGVAFSIGHLVAGTLSPVHAIVYFARGVSGLKPSQAKKQCSTRTVGRAVRACLSLRQQLHPESVALARQVAFGTCWPWLRAEVVRLAGEDENARQNSCEQLLDRKAIKGVLYAKCQRVRQRKRR